MVKGFNKVFFILIIVSIVFSNNFLLAYGDNSHNLKCKSALLMDSATGTIIYEMNSHEKLEPASVTKIMTMLLIMESLDSGKITLKDKVIISKNTSRMTTGTRLMLDEGEVRTIEDLLYGIAVESANDASIAVAEYICGSEEEFVSLMNKRAKELGMNDTNFKNPHGLHEEGHITSAYDIGIISRELIKHQNIFDYISKYMVTVYVGKKNNVKRELVNKNKMVHFYKDVDGIKTGFTDNAMYCISVTAKRNNLRLISVIMGSPDTSTRNKDARKLIDYGFANYLNYSLGQKGDIVKKVSINKGDKDHVNAIFEINADLLIKKGDEKSLEKIVKIPNRISAPISKGQKLGEVIIRQKGQDIANFQIISDDNINKATILNNLKRAIRYWFGQNH